VGLATGFQQRTNTLPSGSPVVTPLWALANQTAERIPRLSTQVHSSRVLD
jgi:hypothetical protein